MRSLQVVTAAAFIVLAFSGCVDSENTDGGLNAEELGAPIRGVLNTVTDAVYDVQIMPAVHQGHGLYEPTIDVSNTGVIYVSAHSTGIGVGPAPGYYSADDGETWATLPFLQSQAGPADTQTSGPPFSDEIFIVAAEDGSAWGVDINLRDFIVAGWCADGTELCYYNPNAYDHSKVAEQAAECAPVPLKDRPWAAVSNGKLFMVNNPGGGPAQIGSISIPTEMSVGMGTQNSDMQWNLCASSGGWIPGIPDLRDDGLFVVPQLQDGDDEDTTYDHYSIVVGHVDNVMDVQELFVMNNTHHDASEIGPYGQAVFDGEDNLFFAAMNNSAREQPCVGSLGRTSTCHTVDKGGIHLAVSTDDGLSFQDVTYQFDQPVSTVYIDGYKAGSGALVNFGLVDGLRTDYYMGHLNFDENGALALTNVMLALNDGPNASRHVQGAAIGPDGRAYMVMSEVSGNDDEEMTQQIGTTPMSVVVQMEGPIFQVAAE